MALPMISQAGVISTPLTSQLPEDTYVSYGGYDWTWASPYNVQFFNCSMAVKNDQFFTDHETVIYDNSGNECGLGANQLLAPSFHEGWSFFESLFAAELLSNPVTLEDYLFSLTGKDVYDVFTDSNGNLINSFEYWNTNNNLTAPYDQDFESDWTNNERFYKEIVVNSPTTMFFSLLSSNSTSFPLVNTVYVRKSTSSQPIPEPSTLLIIAVGLLTISLRKYLKPNH
jgi:hypothetical protein